jgi:cytidylate kinase
VFNASRYKTVEMLTRAIHAFAKQDQVVLVGRGSFAVLQGYANVLNVRVKAPIRIRVNWLMDDQGIASPAEAYKQLRWMDRARANFVERNYGVSLDDMRHFDLVFDTGKVNADRIVSWLVEYVENSIVQIPVPTQNGKTTQHLDVDPVLADYLRERFPVRDRMVPAIAT